MGSGSTKSTPNRHKSLRIRSFSYPYPFDKLCIIRIKVKAKCEKRALVSFMTENLHTSLHYLLHLLWHHTFGDNLWLVEVVWCIINRLNYTKLVYKYIGYLGYYK